LTIDPKRHCRKYQELRVSLAKITHFRLGDVVEFIPQNKTSEGKNIRRHIEKRYEYVEIQDIGVGDFTSTSLLGWELPDRAKHFAEGGDIYVGSIWGSVSKWCLIPRIADDVTNGCHRMRIRVGKQRFLADLVSFLCTESYAVQMRSLARGSDGLAEVTEDDAATVMIPELSSVARKQIEPYIESLLSGVPGLQSKVKAMLGAKDLDYPATPKRPSHVVLV
jgi:type I restriction enzyme M protein